MPANAPLTARCRDRNTRLDRVDLRELSGKAAENSAPIARDFPEGHAPPAESRHDFWRHGPSGGHERCFFGCEGGIVAAIMFGALALAALYWFPMRRWFAHWGTTASNLARIMPGDAAVVDPSHSATMAITIGARPEHARCDARWTRLPHVVDIARVIAAVPTASRSRVRARRCRTSVRADENE